ncbi:hypothetical protein FOA52_010114 [Chlamydomonas sp. UWO 241]|nr:hypothetical protein FOA52_010114 [Chlamydomonas sp. UWO 241]
MGAGKGIPPDIIALAVPVSFAATAFCYTIYRAFAYDPEWSRGITPETEAAAQTGRFYSNQIKGFFSSGNRSVFNNEPSNINAASDTSQRGLTRVAVGAAGGNGGKPQKQLTGACIVRMSSQKNIKVSVTPSTSPGASLQDYMESAADNFANIQLPLGGKISKVDDSRVELVVPRISLFDVWLQPSAIAALSLSNGLLEFTSMTDYIKLEGSSHVKQFKLDERFNLDVRIAITWPNGGKASSSSASSGSDSEAGRRATIEAVGDLLIEVDIPPPFSFMPKGVLTTTGNAAMAVTNGLILDAFCKSLAADYTTWSGDGKLREARRLQSSSSGGGSSSGEAVTTMPSE